MRELAELDPVAEVRGRGLMVGITLAADTDAAVVAGRALEEGLVINVPGPGMLRFLPPLTIGADEVDEAGAIMARVLA
jgi:acetylornithine/succinyldiaminopimelate/putrescine aminotransferase